MSNSIRMKRVAAELKKLKAPNADHPADWQVEAAESDIFSWTITLPGPEDTPFKYGTYRISVSFPDNYPFSAPTVKFLTKIYHPNVYGDGEICVDILGNKWDKTAQIQTLMYSLLYLIQYPNPESAANGQAADFYENSEENYEKEILKWIMKTAEINEKYKKEFDEKLEKHGIVTNAKKSKIDEKPESSTENPENSAASNSATTNSAASSSLNTENPANNQVNIPPNNPVNDLNNSENSTQSNLLNSQDLQDDDAVLQLAIQQSLLDSGEDADLQRVLALSMTQQ